MPPESEDAGTLKSDSAWPRVASNCTRARSGAMHDLPQGERDVAVTITRSDAKAGLEQLARLGYAAKALLYATIGYMAGKAALLKGGGATDTRGAMVVVSSAPFGHWLLLVTAAGLVGYSVWRIVEAIKDPERHGRDAKGLAMRAGLIAAAVVHLALAWTAIRVGMGHDATSGGSETQRASAKAMTLPYGTWLVWAAGALVLVVGLHQLYRMWTAKLSDKLDLTPLRDRERRWVISVSRFGIGARGVVFCVIGVLTMRAALSHQPGRAGIRPALQTLAKMGRVPLGIVAAGLVSYAVYQLLKARYRRIPT